MIHITRPPCPNPRALANKNYKHPVNKRALSDASHGKCMYCESRIVHIDFGAIEHIKPKANNKFPHLEFDWNNLGYCCSRCNSNKGSKYENTTPYVNPYDDDPSDHFIWAGSMVFSKQGGERGQLTIHDIGLNRTDLIAKRSERIQDVDYAISACFKTQNHRLRDRALQELKAYAETHSEYSACISAIIRAHEV